MKQRLELWKAVLRQQVMLSKYANIGFDVTDNMTQLELDTVMDILNEHYADIKKETERAKQAQEMAQAGIGTHGMTPMRTVDVSELNMDELG